MIKGGTNGKRIIGYSSMMAPSGELQKGKVYKMLRLLSTDETEGDIHFFEWKGNDWILAPDHSYVNLSGNENLIDLYQNLPRSQSIDFYLFVELIAQALCL